LLAQGVSPILRAMAESGDGVKRRPKPLAGAAASPKKKTSSAGPKTSARRASGAKPAPRAAASRKAAPKAKAKAAPRRASGPAAKAPRPAARKKVATARAAAPQSVPSVLTEEDQIRSAKYLPRDLPARLFEEERFVFPETYGINRVRLLVKDPDWLFAHWDVDPKSIDALKSSMGERAMALSRLTLRVVDPANGGSSDVLLPPGSRGWYIRADAARRAYKAELGVTLPSGEFRRLAESNVVVTPRVGPSRERAQRRITFGHAGRLPKEMALSQREAELESAGSTSGAGPWKTASIDATVPGASSAVPGGAAAAASSAAGRAAGSATKGGASDTFRPGGASDLYRR